MKPSTRARLPAALFFALSTALPIAGIGLTAKAHAQAQAPTRIAAAPAAIEALEVNADSGFAPGSTLVFTLRGTPSSIARVQVAGTNVSLPLTESRPGVYTGQFTVRRTERGLVPDALIQAELTHSGRTVNTDFSFPPSFAAAPGANAPVAAAGPRVDRFALAPVDRLDPGTELQFALEGTPRAQASIQVPGLPMTLPMQEVRPGRYVANYTLRKIDTVTPGPVVATLRSGERLATSELAIPPQALASEPSPGSAPMGAAPAPAR